MDSGSWAYRALIVAVAVMGAGALVVSSVGLYTILTGGTTDGTPAVDVLGEYDCESFDGDPGVAHNASYGVDRTLLSGNEIESANVSAAGDGFRMELTVAGGVLGASASDPNGTAVPVEVFGDDDRIVLEHDGPARLWIDSVSEDATVTRTQLDVCPP